MEIHCTKTGHTKIDKKIKKLKRLYLRTAALAVLLVFSCTCCSGRSSPSSGAGNSGEQAVIETENTGQADDDDIKEVIRKTMEAQGYDEMSIVNTAFTINDAIPGVTFSKAEPINDKVGKGIRITGKNGAEYNVYIDKVGNVSGIKDLKTGDYVFAVYE